MKYNYILLLLIILIPNLAYSNETIIAYNHDKSIVLTQEALQQWLLFNKSEQDHDLEYQVNSFFLEKALFHKKHIIPDMKLKEIEFNHQRVLYRSAFPIHKKELIAKIAIDPKQYNQLLDDLILKNKNKKDKVRLYQIFKKYPENSSLDTKQEFMKSMLNIRNSISGLDSFKKIAQMESDSQSRLRQGLVGNVYQGLLPQKLNDIVMAMKVGELSDVITTKDGLMLFYCESFIPAKILSDSEMDKTVKNALQGYETKKKWSQFNNKIADDLNVKIDRSKISKDTPNQIIASSKKSNLSLLEIEWIFKNEVNIKTIDENKLTRVLNNYFVSQYLYDNLSIEMRNTLIKKNQQSFINQVTSKVLYELIHDSFKAPSEKALKQYYNQNKANYLRQPHYDVSHMVFNLKSDNKTAVYKTANTILDKLKLNPEDFDTLSKDYLIKSGKILKTIPKNKLGSFFGLNVSKQILLMKTSEISKLIESDNGLIWIIRLNNIEEERQMTFNESRRIIDKKLGNEALDKIKQDTISNIISLQGIVIPNNPKKNSLEKVSD